jgi:anti-sigma B factor antagonist
MATALAEAWSPTEPDVMEVTGRLDDTAAARIEEDVLLCIKSGARRMLLDCRDVPYITAAGLRAVLSMARAMQKTGGRFAVCELQPQVEAMFVASAIDRIIPVFGGRSEALTAFAA